jgi:hypothetical protein
VEPAHSCISVKHSRSSLKCLSLMRYGSIERTQNIIQGNLKGSKGQNARDISVFITGSTSSGIAEEDFRCYRILATGVWFSTSPCFVVHERTRRFLMDDPGRTWPKHEYIWNLVPFPSTQGSLAQQRILQNMPSPQTPRCW